jgi:copper homeostasis protein
MSRILLEVCVDDAAGLVAAAQGGADRIELCAALALGGLTPSAGLIALASESPVPVMAMIRPRAGNFIWSASERRAICAEIASMRAAGLAGVVIGASLSDGRLDAETLAEIVKTAQGLDVTLHRAIDLVPDLPEALALCRSIGIRRILSSGGEATAEIGLPRLIEMSKSGISIMPGGGVTAENVARFAKVLPLREIHASGASPLPIPTDTRITAFGFQPANARGTDSAKIRALRKALDQIAAGPPLG